MKEEEINGYLPWEAYDIIVFTHCYHTCNKFATREAVVFMTSRKQGSVAWLMDIVQYNHDRAFPVQSCCHMTPGLFELVTLMELHLSNAYKSTLITSESLPKTASIRGTEGIGDIPR